MIAIKRIGRFDKMLFDLCNEDEKLEELVNQTITWFVKNPEDTRLDNHPLMKRMKGKWSFSITDDIRIVYKWLGKKKVRFLAIGTHKIVYKKEESN